MPRQVYLGSRRSSLPYVARSRASTSPVAGFVTANVLVEAAVAIARRG